MFHKIDFLILRNYGVKIEEFCVRSQETCALLLPLSYNVHDVNNFPLDLQYFSIENSYSLYYDF